MNQKQITEAYDAAAGKYAERCFDELSYKPLDRLLLDRFAQDTAMGKILDIGCGPGETTEYLYKRGAAVTGVDISRGMIREAKRLNPDIRFETGDMFHLEEAYSGISGICAFYAIVNFQYRDMTAVFHQFYRVLKPGGLLFLAFHVEEKIIQTDDFFESGKPLDFYYFDESRIIAMLMESGFGITEALVRLPYKEEYPSKRAYIFAERY